MNLQSSALERLPQFWLRSEPVAGGVTRAAGERCDRGRWHDALHVESSDVIGVHRVETDVELTHAGIVADEHRLSGVPRHLPRDGCQTRDPGDTQTARERETLDDAGRESQPREATGTAAEGEPVEIAELPARGRQQLVDHRQQQIGMTALGERATQRVVVAQAPSSAAEQYSVDVSTASRRMRQPSASPAARAAAAGGRETAARRRAHACAASRAGCRETRARSLSS